MNDDDITSVEAYGSYLRRELPPLVRRELESMMEGEVEERLRNRIVEMIRSLQVQLHKNFHEEFGLSDAGVPPPGSGSETSRPETAPYQLPPDALFSASVLEPGSIGNPAFSEDSFVFDNSFDFALELSHDGNFMDLGTDSGYGSREMNSAFGSCPEQSVSRVS